RPAGPRAPRRRAPGAWGRSAPAGGGAGARERGGLAGDLGALLDPLVDVVEVDGGGGRIGALGGEPALHGAEELAGEATVARIQVEIRLLRVRDAVQAEECLAAVLESVDVAGLDRQRLFVGGQCLVVLAELAARVADVVPGLRHGEVEAGRLLEAVECLAVQL